MKLVLQEQVIDVSKMKADDMQATLQEMNDFKYEKSKLESLLLCYHYKCLLFSNFTAN